MHLVKQVQLQLQLQQQTTTTATAVDRRKYCACVCVHRILQAHRYLDIWSSRVGCEMRLCGLIAVAVKAKHTHTDVQMQQTELKLYDNFMYEFFLLLLSLLWHRFVDHSRYEICVFCMPDWVVGVAGAAATVAAASAAAAPICDTPQQVVAAIVAATLQQLPVELHKESHTKLLAHTHKHTHRDKVPVLCR